MILLFDVDGTLTPSRGTMDTEFKRFFMQLPNFSLVTGSDVDKTIEQVGQDVFEKADYCFNCSGNDVYQKGKQIYTSDWEPSAELIQFLKQCLEASPYTQRYGNHIEIRTGMVNFSIVGRNAVGDQRTQYHEWDNMAKERKDISRSLKFKFPKLTAEVGGETGIDIAPKGANKSQIIKDFNKNDTLYFFGDAMDTHGNDYPLKQVIIDQKRGLCYAVSNWKDTKNILYERTLGRKISS